MSDKIHLLLLFGGQSCEHEVSVTSARSMLEAVDREHYRLTLVGISRRGRWRMLADPAAAFARGRVADSDGDAVWLDYTGGAVLRGLDDPDLARAVDVVFPVLHGPKGEDGSIQGLLELAGVAYVGSGVVGSAVGMDKELMRRAFHSAGLAQTDWTCVRASAWRDAPGAELDRCESELGFPMFVKPCNLGSSVGISKAHDRAGLEQAVRIALRYDYKVMVEASVEKAREIECAVLGNEDPQASPPGEIIPGAEFYNYETKYVDDKSRLEIPATMDVGQADRLREDALRAFRAVEAFGLARVDFLVRQGEPDILVNEINTIPGFTPISMYPKLWKQAGLDYAQLIDRLVALAMERQREKSAFQTSI